MLLPKRTKFSKFFSRKTLSMTSLLKKPVLNNGIYGLIANENSFVIPQQINSTLRLIRKNLKKRAKIWINFSPNIPITKKPNEVRMGKGKGSVKYWSFLIKKNQLIFEFMGTKKSLIHKTIKASKTKLPFKTTFLSKY